MDSKICKDHGDSLVQLCSYSEVMSNPISIREAEQFPEDTGDVPNHDTTQTRTAVAGSYRTQTETMSNSERSSSHTLSAEAATGELDASPHKRRRSDGSGSLHSWEVVKRPQHDGDIGSICESSQHRNRENTSVAAMVPGVSQRRPSSDGPGSCSIYYTYEPSEESLAGETILPQTGGWVQNGGISSSSINVHPSPTQSFPEPLPRHPIDLTVNVKGAPRRAQFFEDYTLPPLASKLGLSTKSGDSEKIALSTITSLSKDLDDPGTDSAALRQFSHQAMVREPILPQSFETRRWGFVKGSGDTTQVLVAGDWHLGPVLKPFDKACYEDDALE